MSLLEHLKFLELFFGRIEPCQFNVFPQPTVEGLSYLVEAFDEAVVEVAYI